MKPTYISTLAAIALIAGCLSCAKPDASSAGQNSGNHVAISNQERRALESDLAAIAAQANGRVGMRAVILETGETVGSLDPQERFPMQSVYKLPISMAALKQVDAGRLKLEEKVRINREDYVGSGAHSPIRDQYPD